MRGVADEAGDETLSAAVGDFGFFGVGEYFVRNKMRRRVGCMLGAMLAGSRSTSRGLQIGQFHCGNATQAHQRRLLDGNRRSAAASTAWAPPVTSHSGGDVGSGRQRASVCTSAAACSPCRVGGRRQNRVCGMSSDQRCTTPSAVPRLGARMLPQTAACSGSSRADRCVAVGVPGRVCRSTSRRRWKR